MFMPGGGNDATLSLVMNEGGTDLSPTTFSLTKLTTEFTPPEVNETGMQIEPLSGVETVSPGMQLWAGVVLTVPRDITTAVEVCEAFSMWYGMQLSRTSRGMDTHWF